MYQQQSKAKQRCLCDYLIREQKTSARRLFFYLFSSFILLFILNFLGCQKKFWKGNFQGNIILRVIGIRYSNNNHLIWWRLQILQMLYKLVLIFHHILNNAFRPSKRDILLLFCLSYLYNINMKINSAHTSRPVH